MALSGIVIVGCLLNERLFKNTFSPKFNTSKLAGFFIFLSTPLVKCLEFLDFLCVLI